MHPLSRVLARSRGSRRWTTVFGFSSPSDIDSLLLTNDEGFGGSSICSVSLKEYKHFSACRFEGVIDFPEVEDALGGFCNFRTSDSTNNQSPDLTPYDGIALRVKSDGRRYLVNLHPKEHTVEDVYQAELRAPAWKWTTLALPFRDFRLVTRGSLREKQYALDSSSVKGFGITIADGKNGPFAFEIQWVRAFEGAESIPYIVERN